MEPQQRGSIPYLWRKDVGLRLYPKHILLAIFCTSIFFHSALVAQEITQDEALHVRRILEFWRDKEYTIVKSQINQFIAEHPNSQYKDSLLVILGDTYWNEQNYPTALKTYENIQAPHLREKVFNNKLDCLYHLNQFNALATEVKPKLAKSYGPISPTEFENALWVFYYAEAMLRLAQEQKLESIKNDYLEIARDHYLRLLETEHQINAKLALGEIESSRGEYA